MRNWIKHFIARDHRGSARHVTPPLAIYFWDGERAIPTAHRLRNISSSGLYLLTERRWYPGTLVTITLQRTDTLTAGPENVVAVLAKVVRSGEDGVGFKFLFPEPLDAQSVPNTDGNRIVDKKALKRFLQRLRLSHASKLERA
ncbi:PilZ domain-containing protein [Alloacidobacterium dinghuense]|uniref:PilZ domain-containing protein n=1 Tax=Alloacidobacterium dinghuense TaxID=2763107 RepID=A0A7G8BK13_9BACT|nr:PilZ domain-containing protein [Alloacidobacterium dinghuense]QNI32883.1 PilZ domain-containing protein [Alloacidobacterium dinghuense]